MNVIAPSRMARSWLEAVDKRARQIEKKWKKWCASWENIELSVCVYICVCVSKQREQPKRNRGREKKAWVNRWRLKSGQTLRPSPQPHLHKLQRLPLPSTQTSLGACNKYIFNYKHRGAQEEEEERGRKEGEGPSRSLTQSLWLDTSDHIMMYCISVLCMHAS